MKRAPRKIKLRRGIELDLRERLEETLAEIEKHINEGNPLALDQLHSRCGFPIHALCRVIRELDNGHVEIVRERLMHLLVMVSGIWPEPGDSIGHELVDKVLNGETNIDELLVHRPPELRIAEEDVG